jgi:transcriptional regulator with XRE-family HTH domain
MAASALVRSARRRVGLTQAEVAARAELTQAEIARIERAGSNPTAATLERVLRATGHRLGLVEATDIDEAQLRERLRLTPAQRLVVFQSSQRNLTRLTERAQRVER